VTALYTGFEFEALSQREKGKNRINKKTGTAYIMGISGEISPIDAVRFNKIDKYLQ
jgi:hypothetical protein